MRKILTGVLILAAAGSYAQKAKVQAAYNYQKKGVYDKAQEAIELAIAHEQTNDQAKTWIYRGMIYQGIAGSEDAKFAGAQDSALTVALTSYMKGLELDKEDQRYSAKALIGMPELHVMAYNKGLENYTAENFEKATENFSVAAGASQFTGRLDTSAIYNTALSADNGGIDSIAIPMYEACTVLGFGGANTFLQLAQVHKKAGNDEAYVKTINDGMQKHGSDKGLITALANYYLGKGEMEKAEAQLQKAIETDPENVDLLFTIGAVYGDLKQFDKAEESYRRALEIDPEHLNSNYNLGALMVEQGAEINDKANNLSYKESTKIAALNKKADVKFVEAINFLEKVRAQTPDDGALLKTLLQIYSRQGNTEKYKEVKADLDALK